MLIIYKVVGVGCVRQSHNTPMWYCVYDVNRWFSSKVCCGLWCVTQEQILCNV